jgi:hypothetical protein
LKHSTNQSLSRKKIFGEWQKINHTKVMELETKRWIKFVSIGSHLSGGAKTWWRDNYLIIKTIIYSEGKPKLNFIWSKSHHQRKQEKMYLIDIIKKNWYTNIKKKLTKMDGLKYLWIFIYLIFQVKRDNKNRWYSFLQL